MDSLAVFGLGIGILFCIQSCCYCCLQRDINAIKEDQSSHNKCFVCTYEKHMTKYHRQFTSPLHNIHIHSVSEDPSD
jgi:hypothetical protein